MTPSQLAKNNTEAAHQIALFAWAAVARMVGFEEAERFCEGAKIKIDPDAEPVIPELKWLHHIPNGGSRGGDERSAQIQGARLKAQGVKSGVLDLFLPVPRNGCHGLYIEMKKPDQRPKREGSKGGMSDDQIEFTKFVHSQGYGAATCYTWEDAKNLIISYMKGV